MKKTISAILAVALVFLCVPVVSAVNHNGLILSQNTDGTYTITGCNIFTDEVTIPETYNGKAITAIGQGAFQLKRNISYITIPDTIKTIGSMAFYGCSSLVSIYIGESVESIGAKAFGGCSSLEFINIVNTTMIGELAFTGCSSLYGFSSNGMLKVIGKNAFSGCKELSNVDLGEELLYISDRAFTDCIGITDLTFGDKLGYIGNSAFQGCTSLTDVAFGTGELEIEAFAFENCTSLQEITIPDNVTKIGTNAFALRAQESTDFSHSITINCSSKSVALEYAKKENVSVYITDTDEFFSIFGDIDGDGEITTSDAANALDIVSGIQAADFTDSEMFLYDLNSDKYFDTDDVILILKKAAQVI